MTPTRAPAEPARDADVVRTNVDIAAAPERVFRALTDPRELPAWWGSEEDYRTRDWAVDLRPGGAWRATTVHRDGREGTLDGEFRVVERPRVLETSWRASWDDEPSTVRYELDPREVDGVPGTRLTVIHTGPARGATACARGSGALARHLRLTRRLLVAVRRPTHRRASARPIA